MKSLKSKVKPSVEEIRKMKTLMPNEAEMKFMERYNPLKMLKYINDLENITKEEAINMGRMYQEVFYKPFMLFYRNKQNEK